MVMVDQIEFAENIIALVASKVPEDANSVIALLEAGVGSASMEIR